MANVTVSVPDDMKERMDQLSTNWSEVARRCFEKELQDHGQPQRGEIVKELEKVTVPSISKKEAEVNASVEAEIARFEKRYGKPTTQFRVEEEPYVVLSENIDIRMAPNRTKKLVVNNSKISKAYHWSAPDARKWDEDTNSIIEAFNATHFQVGERQFIQSDIENYVYPNLTTSPRREAARNLASSHSVYGLFAYDDHDTIYIGYRKEKIR